jgi:LysM repeat protein
VLLVALLAACTQPETTEAPAGGAVYTGALDTSYEGALDVTSQLALGTLKLEGTGDAVTEDQAAKLLPLWQALGGSALQGDAERGAVTQQIEGTMTEAQVSAIVAMRLTQEDVRAWAQSQGGRAAGGSGQGQGGRQQPGGGGGPQGMSEEQIAQMRQQFQNMSPEERATRRAQFGGQGGPGGGASPRGGGSSGGLVASVVALLAERSGTAARQVRRQRPSLTPTPTQKTALEVTPTVTREATPTPAVAPSSTPTATPQPTATAVPSPTPEPVVHVVQAGDSLAAIAQAYGVTLQAIVEANNIQDPNTIRVGQRFVVPSPARVPSARDSKPNVAVADNTTATETISTPALKWLPDTDPGPPFTIQVSLNSATQDPLVEKSRRHRITGLVRNDGDRTYAVSTIHVTFFDAEGFRGTFRKYPRVPGGEWIWHGKTEAEFYCLLLAPGQACPFMIEITAQDMASFLIHPDAEATERESVPVELSTVTLTGDGTDYLRISGMATNGNTFKVKNITVSGVLLDAGGRIVGLGSIYILEEDIEPGQAVRFDVHVKKEPYTRYQLYAQAERDWE